MIVPLEIRWPMRHGDFNASLRIPLDATANELYLIEEYVKGLRRDLATGRPQRSLEGVGR